MGRTLAVSGGGNLLFLTLDTVNCSNSLCAAQRCNTRIFRKISNAQHAVMLYTGAIVESIESVDSLRQQIAAGGDVTPLRMRILTAILQRLKNHKSPLDDWEMTHFSNAIGSLGLNIHASQQPTFAWLRLCLSDFEKAITPALRDPNFRSPDPSMRDVTIVQLRDAVESLMREVNGTARVSILKAGLQGLRQKRATTEQ